LNAAIAETMHSPAAIRHLFFSTLVTRRGPGGQILNFRDRRSFFSLEKLVFSGFAMDMPERITR